MNFRKYSKLLMFSLTVFLGVILVIQFNKNKIGLNQPIPIIYLDLDENLRNTIESSKRNCFLLSHFTIKLHEKVYFKWKKGFYNVSTEIYDFDQIENQLEKYELKSGGIWKSPSSSTSQNRIAIIVPYRDRLENLKIFLSNIHPFLMRQNVHFGIYLIEPMDNERKVSFNRGLLANIGFLESLKDDTNKWNCFFIHDVDLIPESNLNFYKCDQHYPLQFAVLLKQFDYVPKVGVPS